MAGLPIMNWIRFFVWLAIGLVIYFSYSRKRTLRNNPGLRNVDARLPKLRFSMGSHRHGGRGNSCFVFPSPAGAWGANAERLISKQAVEALPPEMRGFSRLIAIGWVATLRSLWIGWRRIH